MATLAGLWIDHREAVIVFLTSQGEVIKQIRSNAEKHAGRIGGVRSTASYEAQKVPADDLRQNAFTGHLNRYYDAVIACLRDAECVLIFGPGEAKGELKRRIDRLKAKDRIAGVETAGRMTDRQIAAKVRHFFPPEDGEKTAQMPFHPRGSRV